MTDNVGHLVLTDNYQQTEAISLEAAAANELLNGHAQLMHGLQANGMLDHAIEFLPDDKVLAGSAQMQRGLTTAKISVLLAYTKISLNEVILALALPDSTELQQLLIDYFPAALVRQCDDQLDGHPLKREIVTTQLVNRMGTTFVMQIGDETGADASQIAAAWFAVSELLGIEAVLCEVEALDMRIPADQQIEWMTGLREMVAAATRQIIAAQPAGTAIALAGCCFRHA